MKQRTLVESQYAHTIEVMNRLRKDIEDGTPVALAWAFAMVSVQRFHVFKHWSGRGPRPSCKTMLIQQAIQIAIDYWSDEPEDDDKQLADSKLRREEYLELLQEVNACVAIPCHQVTSSN